MERVRTYIVSPRTIGEKAAEFPSSEKSSVECQAAMNDKTFMVFATVSHQLSRDDSETEKKSLRSSEMRRVISVSTLMVRYLNLTARVSTEHLKHYSTCPDTRQPYEEARLAGERH